MTAKQFFPPFDFSEDTLLGLGHLRDGALNALKMFDKGTAALQELNRRQAELTDQIEQLEISRDDARVIAGKLAPLREELTLVSRRIEEGEQGNAEQDLRDALRILGKEFMAAMSDWFPQIEAHWAEILAPFWHNDAKAALLHLQGRLGGRPFDMWNSVNLFAFNFPRDWGSGGERKLRHDVDMADRFVTAILEHRQPFEFLLTSRTLPAAA